jgi:hypothetical protein
MADNSKSILEQALLDAKRIQEALNANTKEILRSVAREEIDGLVKESLNEDYEEEDIEGDEIEGDDEAASPMASDDSEMEDEVDVDVDAIDMGSSEEGDDLEGDYETGMDAVASDEFEMDMTDASDEDVIAVYKKLTGDDEIEVVVDDASGDVTLKVNEPGEFVIKAPSAAAEVSADEFETEDDFGGDDFSVDAFGDAPEMDAEPEMGDEEDEDEVMYEIALDEEIVRTATGDINSSMSNEIAKGEIEGQKANKDSDSGDNLDGGFDDDAVSHANAEGPTVMSEEEDINEEEITEEDEEMEGEESIDEKIQVGKGRNVTNNKTDIVGAGGKANNVKAPNVTAVNETVKKYNALLTEANELKVRNGEYKEALKNFRTMLAETVVFNSNLTYVTKLFMEHSTTKTEKEGIFKRFDNEVSNLKESKKLFRTIGSELSARKPLNESMGNKLTNEVTTSASKKLNESTAYVDKETSRIVDLMNRVNNR